MKKVYIIANEKGANTKRRPALESTEIIEYSPKKPSKILKLDFRSFEKNKNDYDYIHVSYSGNTTFHIREGTVNYLPEANYKIKAELKGTVWFKTFSEALSYKQNQEHEITINFLLEKNKQLELRINSLLAKLENLSRTV